MLFVSVVVVYVTVIPTIRPCMRDVRVVVLCGPCVLWCWVSEVWFHVVSMAAVVMASALVAVAASVSWREEVHRANYPS